jgi:heterodisulfide reductase subunit A-like polyferredoxin
MIWNSFSTDKCCTIEAIPPVSSGISQRLVFCVLARFQPAWTTRPKMSHSSNASKSEATLIVGAGVFGLSTALELKRKGYRHVTVLDRYMLLVADGNIVDISRIIKSEFTDPLYAKIANEATQR